MNDIEDSIALDLITLLIALSITIAAFFYA